jgi:hypothetical protein
MYRSQSRRAIAFGWMEPIKGRIENLVDNVIATRDQRHGYNAHRDMKRQECRVDGRTQYRQQYPREDKDVFNGVVESHDGDVRLDSPCH